MTKEYEETTGEELQKELQRLKDELEDLEDTFAFNLTHTSAHLSSGAVQEHEDELEEMKRKIARVEELMKEM